MACNGARACNNHHQQLVIATIAISPSQQNTLHNPLVNTGQKVYAVFSLTGNSSLLRWFLLLQLAHQRNIVILGLLIYQGVHSGELQKMEVGHISLGAGTVYIPSTGRSISRYLPLQPAQILPIHEYLQQTRPLLKSKGEELFPGNLHNTMYALIQELQGINPVLTNSLHIRGSVIINWLKQHNKRQVQYMAGHKYISSTEAYAIQEMGTLQDELSKHHPFG